MGIKIPGSLHFYRGNDTMIVLIVDHFPRGMVPFASVLVALGQIFYRVENKKE